MVEPAILRFVIRGSGVQAPPPAPKNLVFRKRDSLPQKTPPLANMLDWFYERLTRTDHPQKADLIFVLAGKMERKLYGLHLYQAGLAPRLLLTVGRFEVSKMAGLPFEFLPELIAQRERTAPERRHFFCDVSADATRIRAVALPRWSTYGEALGLREYLAGDSARDVIVVSTDIHLRRAAVTFEKVFAGAAVKFRYCPVPADLSSLGKAGWWTRRDDRNYVMRETVKLAAYRLILSLPHVFVRYLMRLKRDAFSEGRALPIPRD
jgi:uncharacterized SAM-binding protein YcdF (DUF218 family)